MKILPILYNELTLLCHNVDGNSEGEDLFVNLEGERKAF